MPVYVPKGFASYGELLSEGYPVIEGFTVSGNRIGLLNLMPNKKVTERQFGKVFANFDTRVQLVPLKMATHTSKNCDIQYMQSVYHTISLDILDSMNGLIVTGAPVELLDFVDVNYWSELTRIFEHLRKSNLETLFICWSAQAALKYFYGIEKETLDRKISGVFDQEVLGTGTAVLNGLPYSFPTPVSRNTTIKQDKVLEHPDLQLLASSEMSGPGLVRDTKSPFTYMFNHLEYETDTLHLEYLRDVQTVPGAIPPLNYYSGETLEIPKECIWSGASETFFRNWFSETKQPTSSGTHPIRFLTEMAA
ncbi:MAG: homoserine O-acetyltransferase/O-succinyltransferase family protein [Rhizobiaceae bacterium]